MRTVDEIVAAAERLTPDEYFLLKRRLEHLEERMRRAARRQSASAGERVSSRRAVADVKPLLRRRQDRR
jgi:hypothetical protein